MFLDTRKIIDIIKAFYYEIYREYPTIKPTGGKHVYCRHEGALSFGCMVLEIIDSPRSNLTQFWAYTDNGDNKDYGVYNNIKDFFLVLYASKLEEMYKEIMMEDGEISEKEIALKELFQD